MAAMALDVEAEVLIHRPRGEVAALATDPANDARWIGGVDRVRRLDEGPIGVGSRVGRSARFMGAGSTTSTRSSSSTRASGCGCGR